MYVIFSFLKPVNLHELNLSNNLLHATSNETKKTEISMMAAFRVSLFLVILF